MGSPVSPACANLIMEYIEDYVLKNCDILPAFFYRYVDDIITAVPADKVDQFLDSFNNFNDRIKFTIEYEINNCIPFLDVLIHRKDDNTIVTDWYHKKTWSGRYLNFSSSLPMTYKRNTISVLANKILKLSDTNFHQKNFQLLTETLLENNYPLKIIKTGIKNTVHKFNQSIIISNSVENSEVRDDKKTVAIPYIKHLYERIKDLLSNYNIQTVGITHNALEKTLFSKIKDVTPMEQKSNVVYKAVCGCGSCYVGMTKQKLKSRIYQHINDARKKSTDVSALSTHLRNCQHNVTTDNFSILDNESNYKKRKILEMIRIKQNRNTAMNIQTDTAYLQNTYDLIL